MKKLYLLTLCALFWAVAGAAPRSSQEAMRLASLQFRSSSPVAHMRAAQPAASSQALELTHTALQNDGQPAFYVFNRGENDGFVIISAEDRARTILAYAHTGHFDTADIPENMQTWLKGYTNEISRLAAMTEQQIAPRRAQAPKSYTPVAPICSTQWGQGSPYNNKCPQVGDQRCVTGCVATAAAQVMKAHNYPTKGTGSNSYKWVRAAGDTVTLSANFGNTTYQWSSMLNTYTNTATTTQKNAVATLMYHCGIACNMGYGTGASGTSTFSMVGAMVDYFGYDAGIKVLPKDYMEESAMIDAIAEDLQAKRPVMFSASTVSNEGHAFVCDGIDADGLLHINWGWYGNGDAYFRVSALDPHEQGIGGSTEDLAFTERVTAFSQIKPDAGGSYNYTWTCDEFAGMVDYSPEQAKQYGLAMFSVNILQNQSIAKCSAYPACLIYTKEGEYVGTYEYSYYTYNNVPGGAYYTQALILADVSSLPKGEYYLSPAIHPIGLDDDVYIPVWLKGVGEFRCPLTITSTAITVGEPELPEQEEDPTVPTVAYLSSRFDAADNAVLCLYFDDAPCQDVYFVGTPNNWGQGSGSVPSFDNCTKFVELPDYPGWYAVQFPLVGDKDGNISGKPIQSEADGTFDWENQCGDPNAWINRGGKGSKSANIYSGYDDEADIYFVGAGCYIYELAYWKKHTNIPCQGTHVKYNYEIFLLAPNACSEMKPAIIGSFNNWSENVAMTHYTTSSGTEFYYTVINDYPGGTFKFREVNDTDWTNEIIWKNTEDGNWYRFGNFELPETDRDTAFLWDLSDNTIFRYMQCPETNLFDLYVQLSFPDKDIPENIDVLVDNGSAWSAYALNYYEPYDIWYTYVQAEEDYSLAFVEHDNWMNSLLYYDENEGWNTFILPLQNYIQEDEDGKYVALGLSNPDYFKWAVEKEGMAIENTGLEQAPATKVLRDGQLLILRNDLIYTLRGERLKKVE